MSDVSTQLATYQGYEKTTVGKNNTPAIIVKYTRLDGGEDQRGKDLTVRYLVGKLPQDSKDVLSNLKKGDKFVVVKKKEGQFWNLDSFKPESAYKPKETIYGSSNNTTHNNNSGIRNNNNTGIKVGAVLHDAVALAGAGATVAKVATLARELLTLSYKLEEEVEIGAFDPTKAYNNIPETDTEENYTNDVSDYDEVPF